MEISFGRTQKLNIFFQQMRQENIPTTVAFKIYKLLKACETNLAFFQEEYTKLIKTYGATNEKGEFITQADGSITIKDGMIEECQEAITKLNNEKATMPDITFTEKEIESIPNVTIEALEWLEPFMA